VDQEQEAQTVMSQDQLNRHKSRGEGGFALILALLALMLLTMLGLTLATTTTTELQIATNYRYSQQAYYNAEAGIELGKRYLRQIDWRAILPPRRSAEDIKGMNGADKMRPTPYLTRTGPAGEASRNLELVECDSGVNTGYGVVLDDPTQPFPFQNSSQFLGETLNGTFTLWVRRPIEVGPDVDADGIQDYRDKAVDTELVLTAEGTAPYGQALALSQIASSKRAVRYLEVALTRQDPAGCGSSGGDRASQVGSSPTNVGFDNCDPINARGILGGVTEPDEGAE
jgi:hypothetical protein